MAFTPKQYEHLENLAQQKRDATHCKNGHEYTKETLGRHSQNGRRYCKICQSDANYYYRTGILRSMQADSNHPKHGTATGYGCGCKCKRCKRAHADYELDYRKRKSERT